MPIPLENQPTKAFRFAAPRQAKFGVDRNQKILTGVALITSGLEAKGHGIFIDQKTLETADAVLAERNHRFKAAISHLSWSDWWDSNTDRVLEFPGWFSGTRIVGNQLVADKLEFYDTFKADQPRLIERLLEMAEKTPDLFGISLEPWGYLVFVDKKGVEYSERPKDVELANDGLPTLRVTDLSYGAIVDDPAANPGGLFAKLSRKLGESELLAELRALFAAKPAPAAAAPANAVNFAATSESPSSASPSESSSSPMKDLINAIKAEFGADKAKFSRAMTIVGEKPEITLSELKAEMTKGELTELSAQNTKLATQITELTTKVTGLEKSVTDLTAERDEWKKKFTDLKNSGEGKEVTLGAASTGASATAEENPFVQGPHYSLTRQAEITKQNPTLAATLKAAARTGNKTAAKA